MAEADPFQSPIPYSDIGEQFGAGLLRVISASGIQKTITSALVQAGGDAKATALKLLPELPALFGKALALLEEAGAGQVGAIAAPTVDALFDTHIGAGPFSTRMSASSAAGAGREIAGAMLKALSPEGGGELAPGPDGATRVAGAAIGAALGGTFNAVLLEVLTQIIPEDIFHIDSLAQIPDELIQALGLGRLVRQALGPVVQVTAHDPLLWYLHKQYRPTLLPETNAVREIISDQGAADLAREDLARLGYSDARIDALLRYNTKFLSAADVDLLVRTGQWDEGSAVLNLREAGYDAVGAQLARDMERYRRIYAFEHALATAAIAAYAAGRIDDAALDTYTQGSTFDSLESAQLREAADAHRIFNRKQLSADQARQCVLAGVLAVSDYTNALARENYAPDAIDALELLLRQELDAQTDKQKKAAAAAAAKAAQQADKATAAAAKLAAQQQAAKIAQLGSLSALGDAYVRGLIPIDRYNEVASAHYAADTVAILDAELDTKKAAYNAQQAKAADAGKTAAAKGLSVGALTTAVLTGVLTVAQATARLSGLGLSQDAIDVLSATMAAKLAAKQAALATHDQATKKAAVKGLNLAQSEALVRAGHWTMDQYNAQLATLGYDAGAIAGLDELLQDEIDADNKAAGIRAGAPPAGATKGLSASQFLAAVVAGIKTIDAYSSFLVSSGYSADAVATLTAEAQDKLDAANVARSKRATAGAAATPPQVPLADLTRAARLGLITLDAYTAALTARGYSAADVQLETDLLSSEIAASRAADALATSAPGVTPAASLTLAQLAQAVKDGNATIQTYAARAQALGYSADDVQILVAELSDQVAAAQASQQLHDRIAAATQTKEPSLAKMEQAVITGIQTMDQYNAYLTSQGYGSDAAAILDALLQRKVDAAAAKAAKA